MKQNCAFQDRQPNYRYFPLQNGKADVFIYKFVEEKTEIIEGVENTSFFYDVNEVRVNSDEITEEMIRENPMKYLNYKPLREISLEERIEALEEGLLEMAMEVADNG